MNHCIRHFEEPVVASCRGCDKPFCGRCLVFPFGPNKPPYCIGCALTASGVRNNKMTVITSPAKAPRVDKRAERAQRKAARTEAKAAKRAARSVAPAEDLRTDTVPVTQPLETPASRYAALSAPEPPAA